MGCWHPDLSKIFRLFYGCNMICMLHNTCNMACVSHVWLHGQVTFESICMPKPVRLVVAYLVAACQSICNSHDDLGPCSSSQEWFTVMWLPVVNKKYSSHETGPNHGLEWITINTSKSYCNPLSQMLWAPCIDLPSVKLSGVGELGGPATLWVCCLWLSFNRY